MLQIFKRKPERIYLDYASVTPADPRVIEIVKNSYSQFPANPSSLYQEGVLASEELEKARTVVAQALEVHSDEIYFTSGGTEGDNLCIAGVIKAILKNPTFAEIGKRPHIISTNIEHPAIKGILKHLSDMQVCEVSYIPVEENGLVHIKDIKMALRPETVLVSVMYVNNEIGTIQPISEIAKALRHFKKEQGRSVSSFPYFHTDACQALQYCDIRVPSLGIDLMTLDGSKIYGPRGIGAIYIRRGISVEPFMYGGSQERHIRPGTEALPQILGFAHALLLCRKEWESESGRIGALRDTCLSYIKTALEKKNIHVQENGDRRHKVPNNINICIPEIDAEFLVLKLDVLGVAVSSVTSCRSKKEDSSSYVIEALELARGTMPSNTERVVGQFKGCAKSSLRISLGRYTTKKDIEIAQVKIVEAISKVVGFSKEIQN
ncbi:MAG: cysteine desulfurase [Candidatus Taylorbacteria bacterium]|nr:cysteine desulfurase [Candidatus Taylorbacteria bacterium]